MPTIRRCSNSITSSNKQLIMIRIHQYILLFSIFTFAACSNSDSVPSQSDTPAQEVPSSTTVALTDEQSRLANIMLGQPEMRSISDFVECTGMVEVPPNHRHLVHAPVTGFVGSVPQLIGDYVRRGTRLTTLRHPELIQKQRLLLETAAQLEMLEKDVARKRTLAAEDAASQRAFEQAEADYRTQQATFKGLAAELSMIGMDTSQILAGNYQSTIGIYAPVSGYVEQVNVNPGKLVNGADLLYEVLDVTHQHIELKVYARDLPRIREEQRIEVNVPGADQETAAYVYRVGQSIHPETKTAVVHGHFVDEEATIKPGTYVQARIYLDSTAVLSVPEEAVVREGEDAFVFVQVGEAYEKTPVTLGRENDGYLELVDFRLPEGQQMVVRGAYYLNGSMGAEE